MRHLDTNPRQNGKILRMTSEESCEDLSIGSCAEIQRKLNSWLRDRHIKDEGFRKLSFGSIHTSRRAA